jgi:transposase-like protein
MGLRLSEIALTTPQTRKIARKNWREMLRQWLVQCPECSEVRLAVGAHEKDRYICKDCGHSFIIGFQPGDEPSALLLPRA